MTEKCPDWVDAKSKKIWVEDDATAVSGDPDHETLKKAWLRIVGTPFDPKEAVDSWDGGDAVFYLFRNQNIAISSFPGANEIRVMLSIQPGLAVCAKHNFVTCPDCAHENGESSYAAAAQNTQLERPCDSCSCPVGRAEGYWGHLHDPNLPRCRFEFRLCESCSKAVEAFVMSGCDARTHAIDCDMGEDCVCS